MLPYDYTIYMSEKIVVACSGGPDSMALLDRMRKEGFQIVVAHVNYQKRKSANRDEEIVKAYCARYQIPCFVHVPTSQPTKNFQAWAREERYAFFESILKQEHIHALYVAHHLDDLLETYLFQIQRNMLCGTYGLADRVERKTYTIFRPLLGFEKKELEAYCIRHAIAYGIDESNLSDHYTRNKIRHHQIERMSSNEKRALKKEIDQKNKNWKARQRRLRDQIEQNGIVSMLSKEDGWLALDLYLSPWLHRHLSKAHLRSLSQQFMHPCVIDLESHEVERWNDRLIVRKKSEPVCIVWNDLAAFKKFESLELGNFRYLAHNKGATIEGVDLKSQDFPLRFRPGKTKDRIEMRFGTKTLQRFWIDHKIPRLLRKDWYVLENASGRVIFVPGLGCDVSHFSIQPNTFMLQLRI